MTATAGCRARILGDRDDRAMLQSKLDALEPGGVLHLPSGSAFQVRNAERSGSTFQDRTAARLQGELRALTCATDGITVVIDGQIESQSALDDLFRFSGRGVTIKGSGALRGPGHYIDANPYQSGPDEQWRPALLNMVGDASLVQNIRFERPPAIGLYLQGSNSVAEGLMISGGPVEPGSGTFLMGISVGAPVERSSGQKIRDCEFRPSPDGGAVYSGVYVLSSDVELADLRGSGLWHHLVYNYGAGCRISRAIAADIGRAAIQSFAPNCLVESPSVRRSHGGVAVENFAGTRIIDGSFESMGLSAISARRFHQTRKTEIETGLVISGNRISFGSGRRQAGIDIELDCGGAEITVVGNHVAGAPDGTANEAALRVLFTNLNNPGRQCSILDNTAEDSAGFAGIFLGLKGGVIARNRAVNANRLRGETAWWVRQSEDVTVTENVAENTRPGLKTQRILLANEAEFSENRRIIALRNQGLSLARGELPLVSVPQDGRKADNTLDELPVTGRFVLARAGSIQITDGAARAIRRGATVTWVPLNDSAGIMERSAGALRITSLSPGEVSLATGDARLAQGTELYAYRVLQ